MGIVRMTYHLWVTAYYIGTVTQQMPNSTFVQVTVVIVRS